MARKHGRGRCLERIADGVARDSCLVAIAALAAVVASFDVLFGVVPIRVPARRCVCVRVVQCSAVQCSAVRVRVRGVRVPVRGVHASVRACVRTCMDLCERARACERR
jgi:hypothetical protein